MTERAGAFAPELAALAPPPDPARIGPDEVAAALAAPHLDRAGLAALLSPAAEPFLEDLARRAAGVTLARFGRAVRLFAPLYVSNACLSTCTYCGFARGLPIARRTLSVRQVVAEAGLLAGRGFRHLLLVSGEHRVEVSPDYLVECVRGVREVVPSVSVETQTWSDDTYARLVAAGCEGVVHYQETYDRTRYAQVHRAGWKRDFDRRLNAVERAGAAGVRRLGIGALLGLAPDWRADVLAVAAHAAFLRRRFWRTDVTVALPRLKPSAAGFEPAVEVSDAQFVQAVAALRLAVPDAGIVVSTREPPAMRDGLVRIAATTLSAGSSTEPGGYSEAGRATGQFSLSDERTPSEVAAALGAAGYEPVWKDAFPLEPSADPLTPVEPLAAS